MAAVLSPTKPTTSDTGSLTQDDPSFALVAALLNEEIQALSDARVAQRLQNSYTSGENGQHRGRGAPDIDLTDDSYGELESDQIASLQKQLDFLIESGLSKGSIGGQGVNERKRDRLDESDDEGAPGKVQKLMTSSNAESKDAATSDEKSAAIAEEEGKGKGKARIEDDDIIIVEKAPTVLAPPPRLSTCQICFDPCRPVSNPFDESNRACSSNQAVVGMYLGRREDDHLACVNCLGTYVETKLNDNSEKAFPIHCPQCKYEITDEDATRIFGFNTDKLERWHWRKLVDDQPPLFCPNQECSARIVHDAELGDQAQAACPSCHKMLCVPCGVVWHSGYTCKEYQSIPADERSPDDFALFALAKEQKWSRCPGCKVMMERVKGCAHMVCSCGVESCYRCGDLWSNSHYICRR